MCVEKNPWCELTYGEKPLLTVAGFLVANNECREMDSFLTDWAMGNGGFANDSHCRRK